MNSKDPAGYYELLGISETASTAEIKSAFRRRAKELHPDRNPSSDAEWHFQQLNEAYQVLSDPDARAQYDTLYTQIPQSETAFYQEAAPDPIICFCCQKVTAQPRYVIFFQITSFLFVTIRTPIQGIFCSKCAESMAFKGTVITWLMGWWSSWGLIYSLPTILKNLLGGSKPNEVNARLLTYQAYYFATQNKFDLAHAVAKDAEQFARKIKKEEKTEILNVTTELLSALSIKQPSKRLKNVWFTFNRAFYIQGSLLVIVIALIIGLITYLPVKTEQASSSKSSTESNSSSTSSELEFPIKSNTNSSSSELNSAYDYYSQGIIHLEQKELEQALQNFNQAIQLNPDNGAIYFYRGLVYSKQGELEQALQDFNQAIQYSYYSSHLAEAYLHRGLVYGKQGKLEKELKDYNQAIQINSEFTTAYYNRGVSYIEKGKLKQALEDFNQAIKLNPNFAEAYENRGAIYEKQGNREKAIENFEKAITLFKQQGKTKKYKRIQQYLNKVH